MGRGFGITSAVGHDVVGELAHAAEELGYTSFWVNDMPRADGLESLAAAARSSSRIDLGIGVIPLDQRPPAAIAERVTSLGLPLDRLLLGVGSGGGSGGLARVRSGVDELRSVIVARVVVGALGPKMAAVAGESDGVVLNWLTPEHAERSRAWVLGTAASGDGPRPSILAYVRCGLSPGADARLAAELERYEGLQHFAEHLARVGASAPETCVLGTDAAALQSGIARYETVLDETIVRAVTPTDHVADLLALLHACAPVGTNS